MDKLQNEETNRIYFVYSEFDPSARICMYLPMSFFQKDLKECTLFFKKKKEFVDYRETSFPLKHIFFVFSAVGENVPQSEGASSHGNNQEEIKRRIELFRQYKEHGDLLTSCWTLREDENYLMWDSYAHKKGVRIMTTIDKFVCSLKTNDYEVLCGRINYQNYDLNKGLERNLYTKEKYFANEEEFRFYLVPVNKKVEGNLKNSDDPGFAIPFDWESLAPDVLISPFYPKNCASCIQQDLKQTYSFLYSVECSKIEINQQKALCI